MSIGSPGDLPLDDPFGTSADPRRYVPRPATERTLEELVRVVRDERRCAVLSGPPGIGKTFLLRVFADLVAPALHCIHLPYAALPAEALCAWALDALGASRTYDTGSALVAWARRPRVDGQGLALLVDDAEVMSESTARELGALAESSEGTLRILAASAASEASVVRESLGDADRIDLLEPMSAAETAVYVRAHLEPAVLSEGLRARFDAASLAELYERSEGVPGRVNTEASLLMVRAGSLASLAPPAEPQPVHPPEPRPEPLSEPEAEETVGSELTPEAADDLAPLPASATVDEEPAAGLSDPDQTEPVIEVDLSSPAGPLPPALESLIAGDRVAARLNAADATADAASVAAPDAPMQPTEASQAAEPTPSPKPTVVIPAAAPESADPAASEPASEPHAAPPGPAAEPEPPDPTERAPGSSGPDFQRAMDRLAFAHEASQAAKADWIPSAPPIPAAPEPARRAWARPALAVLAGCFVLGAGAGIYLARQAAPPRAPVAEAGAPAPPPAPTERRPVPEPERDPAPPPVARVSVQINATPWATISIDGEEVGETPLAHPLPAGEHSFQARFPDGRVAERVHAVDASNRFVTFE